MLSGTLLVPKVSICFLTAPAAVAPNLLQCGNRQPLSILQFSSNHQPLSSQSSKGGSSVLPVCGQDRNIQRPGIVTQDRRKGVEKCAFPVSPSTVGKNNPFMVYLAEKGHPGHHLKKAHQRAVPVCDSFQEIHPHFHSSGPRGAGRHLRTKRAFVRLTNFTGYKINDPFGGVQLCRVRVQSGRVNGEAVFRQLQDCLYPSFRPGSVRVVKVCLFGLYLRCELLQGFLVLLCLCLRLCV